MSIEKFTTDYLLELLEREFPACERSLHQCAICNDGCRGKYCVDCLCAEIKRRSPAGAVGYLLDVLRNRDFMARHIVAVKQQILEAENVA